MKKSLPKWKGLNITTDIKELEEKFDDDTESIITNERYRYISSVIDICCKKISRKQEWYLIKLTGLLQTVF